MASGMLLKTGFLFVVSVFISTVSTLSTDYNVGIGIADITGPAAEVNLMGYANPGQTSHGLHLRQFSRTFIISDSESKSTVVFISIDACMFSQGLKLEIVKQLQKKYGNLYTERNVCISGTHTHSGPAGFHQYILYDITSLGFVKETFDSLVDGIVKSVERAHDNIQPANMYVNTGELLESNINRSPSAYLFNPPEERAKYKYDTDKNMTLLKIVDANDTPIGMISWFAVHCTSMNNTNQLISSDNKGLASILFEADMNGDGFFPGKGKFVAAFAQANLGDVSPNTKGPHCMDTGLPCDTNTSTCNGRNEMCVSPGPGKDMFESTQIIGTNQYKKAMDLFNSAKTRVSGPVDFRHTYTDMTKQTVGEGKHTCKPAMGYSFAAGTTDGPGAFDFEQGSTKSNPFWNLVSGLLHEPSVQQIACHSPKPILLDTGSIDYPYAWEPSIVDTQILKIGQVVMIAVPAEFTTMSGRRMREAVEQSFVEGGASERPITVIAGLSNDYSDYVTTYEEYQQQRYEGGSTIFGPHTLEAYIQVYKNMSNAMAKGSPIALGPNPPNLISEQLSFLPPVVFDTTPFGKSFGDVINQPAKSYTMNQRVEVKFVGANPRNDRKAESSFLEVLFKEPSGNWTVQFTDANWETRFAWKSVSIDGQSEITITWDIPADQKPGSYKIAYYGNSKAFFTGDITPFSGMTNMFIVASAPQKVKSAKLMKYLQKQKLAAMQNENLQNKKNYDFYSKLLKYKSQNDI